MNRETFAFHWERLCNAFTVSRADDKAKVYFDELEKADGSVFARAVAKVIREDDRFPSIAKLLTLISTFSPKEEHKAETCSVCDGAGMVYIWGTAYRGNCKHGQRLSPRIKVAPLDPEGIAEERAKQKELRAKVYGVVQEPFAIPAVKNSHWWL